MRRLYGGKTANPWLRAHAVAGCALLVAGLVLTSGGVAYATFSGTYNGNIAFIAICDTTNVGQAVYSINPNNTSPAYSCPGGANPYAKLDGIIIIRSTPGGQRVIPFRYGQVSAGKDLAQNVDLESGDIVVVP